MVINSNNILAIDDDPMIHKLLEFSLKEADYELEHCLSAEEGQKVLAKNSELINAIILDWEMPGMNGIELLKWLKTQENFKDIPVIMLTANNTKEHIKKGIDAGAYYYLVKPFNKDLLKSIVATAVDDYIHKKSLIDQVRDSKNPLGQLDYGKFSIRLLEEAHKLSINISNSTPNPEETLMISELLTNAIEHGNLGINYSEKSQLLDDGVLHEEVEKRILMPEYADKVASVEFKRFDGGISVKIEDQGDGFDYKKYLDFDPERVFDNHGRGIAMANNLLKIKYSGKGNIVEVTIPIHD